MLIDRRLFNYFDWMLFATVLTIPLLGMIVLFSAGHDPDGAQRIFSWLPFEFSSPSFGRQVVFLGLGLAMMALGATIPPSIWHKISYVLLAACIFMLAAVLVVGIEAKGAQRWLGAGSFTFQPSEVTKLAVILALARYLGRSPPPPGGYGLLQLIVPGLMFGIPMLLIVKQPDLGTALALGGTGFCMVMFMGIRWRALLLVGAAVIAAVIPMWLWVLRPYQKMRVMVLFNPEKDPLGSGYHIIQSKIAVGSGSLFGKGFMRGTQTQLEFLPEHTTDFIFSVLAEEWGFFGCAMVIGVYAFLMYRLLRVVSRSKDPFGALVTFGIAAHIFVNASINIGMVIGLLPVVGLPLPLFSYGGTSLTSTMFALGIALGVSMRRFGYLVNA